MESGTKKRHKIGTKEWVESLPRGLTIGTWSTPRPKPFFLRWGNPRQTESFADEVARNRRAVEIANAHDQHDELALSFNPKEWADYLAFRRRCTAPFEELESLWRTYGIHAGKTTQQAVDAFLALLIAEGMNPKGDTYSHLKLHLNRLSAFAPGPLSAVSADRIRDWLAQLGLGAISQKHHRKSVFSFFRRAIAEGWVAKNPVEAVKSPKVEKLDKPPLTVAEVKKLLRANLHEPVVLGLAMELFGGLRCSTVERMRPEWLQPKRKAIRIPAKYHKSGTTKFIQGQPDVFWEWVAHGSAPFFAKITHKNYDERKAEAFIRAGVVNAGNSLRRTFASYHLATYKNISLLTLLTQHTSFSTTQVYLGVADEDDGNAVMALTPQAVSLLPATS